MANVFIVVDHTWLSLLRFSFICHVWIWSVSSNLFIVLTHVCHDGDNNGSVCFMYLNNSSCQIIHSFNFSSCKHLGFISLSLSLICKLSLRLLVYRYMSLSLYLLPSFSCLSIIHFIVYHCHVLYIWITTIFFFLPSFTTKPNWYSFLKTVSEVLFSFAPPLNITNVYLKCKWL